MPTVENYESHAWVLEQLKKTQEAESDMRDQSREAHAFVDARDGQWEQDYWEQNDGKPRYTFDLVNPILDQVAGDIERKDFDIRVSPGGGDATKEVAATFDGIIRNIEQISGAEHIYSRATRNMLTSGLDGWRVSQKFVEGDSFDQDLVIEKIGNYLDRVWLGPHEEPDGSDANYGWVLTGMDREAYKAKYKDRAESGVDTDRTSNVYYHREDLIMVGEFIYLKPVERELALMSDGSVYAVDDAYKRAKDEFEQDGITEVSTRKRIIKKVYTRLFDNAGFIGEPQETVFQNWIPVIPEYANFKVVEDKVIYWGVVEKLMDAQRVFNYSLSREVEEGALAPREKTWMTPDQASGHEDTLETLNTNSDPVQLYNHVDGQAAPYKTGGAQINPGLRTISESAQQVIGHTAGMFAANMGENPGLQSGVAIEALQDRGDTGNNKFITSREIAQRHTARILVDAIPRVYTPGRVVRLLKEDGSQDAQSLGTLVQDQQTGETIYLNELSQGIYDVVCSSGPSFKNRQNETVSSLTELAKVDPTILETGGDILLNNMNAPGMDQLAERRRLQLFMAGAIPYDQMTDEEKQQYEQMQQQPPPEDPMMVAARAEEAKAMADHQEAQNKATQIQMDGVIQQKKLEVDAFKAETDRYEAQVNHAKAMSEIEGNTAEAAKKLAEAEAQDIENNAVKSGVMGLVEKVSGQNQ